MFCAKRIDIPFHLWSISNGSIWYIHHMMDHSISHEKQSHTILSSIIYHVIKNRYASPSIVILHHKHVCLFAHSDRLQQCNKQIDHIFICKYFVSWLFVVFLFALPSSFVYYNWELSKTLFILLQFLKESLASPVNGLLQ